MYYRVYVVAKIGDIDERMTADYNRFNVNFIFTTRNKDILPLSTIVMSVGNCHFFYFCSKTIYRK